MLKDRYVLDNRYGDKYVLEKVEDNKYLLKTDTFFVMRCGIAKESQEYTFIDPPGGPMLKVGSIFQDCIISRISKANGGYYIYLKDRKDDISGKQSTNSI